MASTKDAGWLLADRSAASPELVSASEDDGSVPDKQIWRWQDDGGAVARAE